MPEVITKATKLLENIRGSVLKEVTLEFGPVSSILGAIGDLSRNCQSQPDAYNALERTLLQFSQPEIIWTMGCRLRVGRKSFWTAELGRQFPLLSQRGALVVKSELGERFPTSTTTQNIQLTADLATPAGHDATLQALVVSPQSKWMASGSEDFTVILWDPHGNIAHQWATDAHESVWSLAFSPDGQYLVCGDGAGRMEIRDLNATRSHADPPKIITLDGHCGAPVSSCAWSPDGHTIASGSFDGTVRLWDAHTFQELHMLKQQSMKGMQYVAFSPNGRWLVSWCFPCNYCIWDVASGALHKFIPPDEWHGTSALRMLDIVAAFDSTSTRLATLARNDTVGLWDVETGRRHRVLRRVGEANDVSFSPDGRWLLTASSDRTVRIWDAHNGVELRRLRGHTSIVSKACFSPCGTYIASASWDETVRVWRTRDGSCMATFSEHENLVTHVAFSPDGKALVSGARNGTVVLRHMHDIISVVEHNE